MKWVLGMLLFCSAGAVGDTTRQVFPDDHFGTDSQSTTSTKKRTIDDTGGIPGVYGPEKFTRKCGKLESKEYLLVLVERGGKHLKPAERPSDTEECALVKIDETKRVIDVLTANIDPSGHVATTVPGTILGDNFKKNREYFVLKQPGELHKKDPPLFAVTSCKLEPEKEGDLERMTQVAGKREGWGPERKESIIFTERNQENGVSVVSKVPPGEKGSEVKNGETPEELW